jgi:hypothetical protein
VIRRVTDEEGQHFLHVLWQRNESQLVSRYQRHLALLPDEFHPQEFIAPLTLRQQIRGRKRVARAAHNARLRFFVWRCRGLLRGGSGDD